MTQTAKEAKENGIGVNNKWNPFKTLFAMRREAPEFRRCCFCVPLRRGVIGWAYIKIALDMLAIGSIVSAMIFNGLAARPMVQVVLLLIDVAFNVLLIVGGYLKNVKVLKITYVYSLVWLTLEISRFCWSMYMAIQIMSSNDAHLNYFVFWLTMLPALLLQFTIFFVQIYWILLLRSLVAKLQDQTMEFQFTNASADEAECTLQKPNPSPPEAHMLHKHNPSADVQNTLHNPSTNTSDEETNIDTSEHKSSKYTKF